MSVACGDMLLFFQIYRLQPVFYHYFTAYVDYAILVDGHIVL